MSKDTLTAYGPKEIRIRNSEGRSQTHVLKANERKSLDIEAPSDIVVFTGPRHPGVGQIVVEPSSEPGIRIVPERRA